MRSARSRRRYARGFPRGTFRTGARYRVRRELGRFAGDVAVLEQVPEGARFHFAGGGMDILVMLDEAPDHSPVLAHVNSVPAPLDADRPWRDVVTLYGVPNPESLALALAAAVESHRSGDGSGDAIRHLGLWPERGALGDAAWRDVHSGQLMTRDLEIPLERLRLTAGQLLAEF